MAGSVHAGSSSSSSSAAAESPWIFLSHSGHQKAFTRRLNEELLHVGHHPFFDEDAVLSLPKGHPFPHRILEACQGCKMGIIVLSPQYIQSFWPMLELQHLQNHAQSLYPLFYEMEAADVTNDLQHWQDIWEGWESKGPALQQTISLQGSQLQINMDITSWPGSLKDLRNRSGEVRTKYSSDDDYLKAIVHNVCSALPPPPRYMLSDHVQGGYRIQQDIDDLFKQHASGADGVTMLGLFGIGGSGKSTLCKNMANYYSKEFLGKSCWLELPSCEYESQQLLHKIKEVLPTFAQAADKISTLEEAMTRLEEGLNRNKVFLALDNVWDLPEAGGWETAKKIMLMNCMPGSKIMVTSRSKKLLEVLLHCREEKTSGSEQEHLLKSNIVHVPSITKDEAMQALMSYSCFSHSIPQEVLSRLAESCFFGEQCYPLYLQTIGAELRARGRASFSDQKWKELLFDLQSQIEQGDDEDTVVNVIIKSFKRLSPELQNIFKDLVTCMPEEHWSYLSMQCKWLSFLHDGFTTEKIRSKLLKLEYHGLLEIRGTGRDEFVSIHDLHKLVARRTLSPDAPGKRFLESDDLDLLSKEEWSKKKYIYGQTYNLQTSLLCRHSNLEILYLKSAGSSEEFSILCGLIFACWPILLCPSALTTSAKLLRLSANSMKALRVLGLSGFDCVKKISGWEGAPNLVSLTLDNFADLIDVGLLESLLKLEELTLTHCRSLEVVNVGKLQKLQILNLSRNVSLVEFFFVKSLVWAPPNLQELNVARCWSLKSLPNLRDAAGLKTLRANRCSSLREVKLSALALTCSLQILGFAYCHHLRVGCNSHDDARSSYTALEFLASVLCDPHQPKDLAGSSAEEMELMCTPTGAGVLVRNHSTLQVQAPLLHSSVSVNGLLNLQELVLQIHPLSCSKVILLNVSGLPSLQVLRLGSFQSLQEIACLNSLVNLEYLELRDCASLKEIIGLHTLTKLKTMRVMECSSLKQIVGLGRHLNKLRSLEIKDCHRLANVSELLNVCPAGINITARF